MDAETVAAARAGDHEAFARLFERHRRELRAHCYRMAGSIHEADDLLQESMLRAWRGLARFEGRSSLRVWLYRVTTNTCLDVLASRRARVLPQSLGAPLGLTSDPNAPLSPPGRDVPWIGPCPRELEESVGADLDAEPSPEARLSARESVALAFLALLQTLPPRQRAVLLLRDVVGWEATACAEALEMTVAAVNSALQRARETLGDGLPAPTAEPSSEASRELLARYLAAWESSDVAALVRVLRHDATLAMPPMTSWFEGAEAIGASIGAMVLVPGSAGRFRGVATWANGAPAFQVYVRDDATGEFHPQALHVLTLDERDPSAPRIAAIDAFIDPTLPALFGLPAALPAPALR